MPTEHIVPEDLRDLYRVREWRNAAGVLSTACPEEWAEVDEHAGGHGLHPADKGDGHSDNPEAPEGGVSRREQGAHAGVRRRGRRGPVKDVSLGATLGLGMTAAGGWGKEGPYPLPPINRIRNHFDIASIAATEIKISTIAYAT